ncbi:MAG: GNAT family N-acetyltransferase [Tannerellaceae bacterium]|nr:GNAT family N-acetyltransferase [Tannerellaceae bacterium]
MNASEVSISRCDFARPAHRQAIGDLINAYINDRMGGGEPLTPDVSERLVASLATHPTVLVLLAERGDVPIGLLTAFENVSTFTARPMMNIHDLFVYPAYRRCGLARRLMEALIDEARRRKCSRITLEVRQDNLRAQALYNDLGFRCPEPPMIYQRLNLNA